MLVVNIIVLGVAIIYYTDPAENKQSEAAKHFLSAALPTAKMYSLRPQESAPIRSMIGLPRTLFRPIYASNASPSDRPIRGKREFYSAVMGAQDPAIKATCRSRAENESTTIY